MLGRGGRWRQIIYQKIILPPNSNTLAAPLLEYNEFCSKIARNYFLLDNCTNSSIYPQNCSKNTNFCPKIATIFRLPCPKFARNYQMSWKPLEISNFCWNFNHLLLKNCKKLPFFCPKIAIANLWSSRARAMDKPSDHCPVWLELK